VIFRHWLFVSVDKNPDVSGPFVEREHYTFPVLPAKGLVDDRVPEFAIPSNWIVDAGGMLRFVAAIYLITLMQWATLAWAGGAPSFEVVSVKPMTPQGESREPIGLFTYPGGRIRATNYTLRLLIQEAFEMESYRILGGPAWADADRYVVEAKPPASSPSAKWVPENFKSPPNAEMRLMIRSLLADRFQLKVHRESKPGTAYALLVAKGGPRLQAPKDLTIKPAVRFGRNGTVTAEATSLTLTGQNATIAQLAASLAVALRTSVSNQTALGGNFDFVIEYAANDRQIEAAPFLVDAVKQIGLELKKVHDSMEVLVIDEAEKPSAN
jgi:uncharacterized protein (TIGR03435 family)